MNWSSVEVGEVPPGVVTVISTVPVPAASTAVICVDELTVKLAAAVLPKFTVDAPVNPLPVMITLVPPVAGPVTGFKPVVAGTGAAIVMDTVAGLLTLPSSVAVKVKLSDP